MSYACARLNSVLSRKNSHRLEKNAYKVFVYRKKFSGYNKHEAYKKAVENGATSVLEPELEPWGQKTCYIADPEGNMIEIGSWDKPYEEKDLTEGC